MYKLTLPFLLLTSGLTHAKGLEPLHYSTWGEVGKPSAFVTLGVRDEVEELKVAIKKIQAVVGHSVGGEKKVYFDIHFDPKFQDYSNANPCDGTEPKTDTIKINNQSINVSVWCEEYTNISFKYLSFSAKTKQGKEFIINAFQSKDAVSFEYEKDIGLIPAIGFAEVWNNAGGNAL